MSDIRERSYPLESDDGARRKKHQRPTKNVVDREVGQKQQKRRRHFWHLGGGEVRPSFLLGIGNRTIAWSRNPNPNPSLVGVGSLVF